METLRCLYLLSFPKIIPNLNCSIHIPTDSIIVVVVVVDVVVAVVKVINITMVFKLLSISFDSDHLHYILT